MNIIEKLGITAVERFKLQDKVKFGISCETGKWVRFKDCLKLKQRRDELLEALIEDIKWYEESIDLDSQDKELEKWYKSRILIIEKAADMPWIKIKESYNA